MTTDTTPSINISETPLSNGGGIEVLSPQATRRLQTISDALVRLQASEQAIYREKVVHASVLQVIEDAEALDHAERGVQEWSAPRNPEAAPAVTEKDFAEIETYVNTAQAREADAHAKLDDVEYLDLSSFEERLASV